MMNLEIRTYYHGVAHIWKVTASLAKMVSHAQGKLHSASRIDVAGKGWNGGSGRSKTTGRVSVVFRKENSKGSHKEIVNANNYTDRV